MSDDPRDRLRFETLTDMSLSCTAALDILNDLLCFEKLESGILDLHKQEVHVMPFLHDCVNMFAVQAKECDVTMTVYTDFDRTECASHHNPDDSEMGSSSRAYGESEMSFLTLEDADVVMIDKFKMDQVIRNLISNALKFTPRGGRISIKVSFVPNSPSIQSSSTCSKNSSGHDKRGLMRQESYFSKSMNSLYAKYAFRPSQRKIFPDSSSGGAGEWGNMDVEATGGRSDSARYEMSNLDSNDGSNVSTISGKLVIIVTDSGAGISADNQKRLFKEIVQFQPEILQVCSDDYQIALRLHYSSSFITFPDGYSCTI